MLLATGSEVAIAHAAAQQLAADGVRVQVASLPAWNIFAAQSEEYRNSVLPPATPKVAIEAAVSFGWERWVGNDPRKGVIIGIDHFGASAPYQRVYQEFGLTTEAVVTAAKKLLS